MLQQWESSPEWYTMFEMQGVSGCLLMCIRKTKWPACNTDYTVYKWIFKGEWNEEEFREFLKKDLYSLKTKFT